MSGAGLTAKPSSAQTDRVDRVGARPSAASVASVGSRSSVVATAIRRPLARSRANRRRQVGQRDARARPGRARARPRRAPRRAAARSDTTARPARRDVRSRMPGHRRGGQRRRRRRRAPVTGSKPSIAKSGPATGRRSAAARPSAERRGPAAPHRVEVDERAVLVEDDEVDAVEPDGHTLARRPPRRRRRVATVPRRGRSTASGGNETVTGLADVGQRQVRLVERVERRRSSAAPSARRRRAAGCARPSPGS